MEIKSVAISSGHQTFSEKDRIINILDFASHIASITAIQLCHCSAKAVTDSK